MRAALAARFGLTEEELAQRLPSGLAKTFNNRVGWAATYLYRVGLLARPRRAVVHDHGTRREVLAANAERVDLAVLSQFPELAEFTKVSGTHVGVPTEETGAAETATPEERIDAAYQELRQALVAELRDRVLTVSPTAFEDLVLDVLHAMGYGDGPSTPGCGRESAGTLGSTRVIREDRLGLDVVYVQAKRWQATVGRPEVQGFVGALQGARPAKGIMFTASTFSSGAHEYAASVTPRVVLVDGQRLATLMIDHDVGVSSDRETYAVKRVDNDYFGDDA